MSYIVYRISKRKRYVNGESHGVCCVAQYASRMTQYGMMEVMKDAALVCKE